MAVSGKNTLTDRFLEFFREYYSDEVSELAQKYPNEKRSLYIDFDDLYVFDHDLAEDVRSQPGQLIEYAEEALELYDLPADISLQQAHVRIFNLPESVDIREMRIHDDHVGSLISIQGIVRKATDVRPKIIGAVFECQRCGTMNTRPQVEDRFDEPNQCVGCEREGPFRLDFDQSEFVDAQTIRVQESPEDLIGGETPKSIDVNIEDDIVGSLTPGDHVTVVGALHIEQVSDDNSRFFDLYMDGVTVTQDDKEFDNMDITSADESAIEELAQRDDIFSLVVDSIAPTIYGYNTQKLAIALQLFGGVPKKLPDGSEIRGDFHLLMVGDPGTGKSMLLSYIDNIAPRSVYTSGKGASSAGLTASAVRDDFGDDGQWTLEAGALVLADKGVAAIDELDKMDDNDRSAMHEALEQQQVSISKAGINATLKSRCSLLAAANPVYGRFDRYESLPQQINLEPALISRFDLIFTVTDVPDPERDAELADHIIESNYAGEMNAHKENVSDSSITTSQVENATQSVVPEIEPDLLQKYIAYAKRNCIPTMTPEAQSEIKEFYVDLRTEGIDEDDPIPVTARKLEALVRLSEASARVRLSEEVTVEDANRAIKIVRSCLEDIGIDPETGEFDADVIATGQSKTQRDRDKTVESIIRDLQDDSGDGVHIDEIRDIVEEVGLDVDLERELEDLHQRGMIYEPQQGYFKPLDSDY